MSYLSRALLATLCLCLLGISNAPPAQAILGVDYETLKYYRNKSFRKERFSEDKLERFLKARKAVSPMHLMIYTDDAGLIQREYWQSTSNFWTLRQAHQIRDAILGGYDTPVKKERSSLGITYTLRKGGKVHYRMSGKYVLSVEAHTEAYDPGNLGRMPNTPLARPRLLRIE